jgi:hypothetical protein
MANPAARAWSSADQASSTACSYRSPSACVESATSGTRVPGVAGQSGSTAVLVDQATEEVNALDSVGNRQRCQRRRAGQHRGLQVDTDGATSVVVDDTSTQHAVPPALVPPTGHVLSSVFRAHGVQVYQCTAGAWTFLEPAANLTGRVKGPYRAGRHTAIHFRGPSWESTKDGSLVEAKVVASSPVPGSIPQLLLQATKTRGDGAFGHVTYVQRLATSGGVTPTGACPDGHSTGVAYQAEYRFYVPAS